MASATHNYQFAVWPGPGKFPRRDERARQVKASMDQDAGNGREPMCLSQQYPLFQPGVVRKIVRHDAGKRERGTQVLIDQLEQALRRQSTSASGRT